MYLHGDGDRRDEEHDAERDGGPDLPDVCVNASVNVSVGVSVSVRVRVNVNEMAGQTWSTCV